MPHAHGRKASHSGATSATAHVRVQVVIRFDTSIPRRFVRYVQHTRDIVEPVGARTHAYAASARGSHRQRTTLPRRARRRSRSLDACSPRQQHPGPGAPRQESPLGAGSHPQSAQRGRPRAQRRRTRSTAHSACAHTAASRTLPPPTRVRARTVSSEPWVSQLSGCRGECRRRQPIARPRVALAPAAVAETQSALPAHSTPLTMTTATRTLASRRDHGSTGGDLTSSSTSCTRRGRAHHTRASPVCTGEARNRHLDNQHEPRPAAQFKIQFRSAAEAVPLT